MLICLAIFWSSTILWSSMSLFTGGPFSELVLFVVVIARESLLFLKIRRMMLLIVLMALLILWPLRAVSSYSWKICTLRFRGSYFFFPFFVTTLSLDSSSLTTFVEEPPIVVPVAGFVLRDPFDSPVARMGPFYGETYFIFESLSLRPRT